MFDQLDALLLVWKFSLCNFGQKRLLLKQYLTIYPLPESFHKPIPKPIPKLIPKTFLEAIPEPFPEPFIPQPIP